MPKLEVALATVDGTRQIVNIGRPAVLIAFADEFGKAMPGLSDPRIDGDENVSVGLSPTVWREYAWCTHRALGIEQPLDEWVETLDELTANDDAVEALRVELAQVQGATEQDPPTDNGVAPRAVPLEAARAATSGEG